MLSGFRLGICLIQEHGNVTEAFGQLASLFGILDREQAVLLADIALVDHFLAAGITAGDLLDVVYISRQELFERDAQALEHP